MHRQNLFADVRWDGEDAAGLPRRIFWRPDHARMGATLYELGPGYPGDRIHLHYGAEEMFFVVAGRPFCATWTARNSSRQATSSSVPRGGRACTTSATRTTSLHESSP